MKPGQKKDEVHEILVDRLLFAFGSRPDVRCWKRDVGLAVSVYTGEMVKYGITGETDLQGIVAPRGRLLGVEAKTFFGSLQPKQKRYRDMILKFGGIYILAYSRDGSEESLTAAVNQAIKDFESQL